MRKITLLHRAMVVNRVFSYSTLERQAGLSHSFVFKKLKEYEVKGFIRRAGLGKNQEKLWRLTQEGKRQFDPHAPKEPAITDVAGVRTSMAEHGPERRLWVAIRELKRFGMDDLLELNLANDTTTRQYVALLRRAGLLIGERVKNTKAKFGAPMVYTVAEEAGDMAPLMGRCFYLFDPNTRAYFSTPMEKFDEKKRPGDVAAS